MKETKQRELLFRLMKKLPDGSYEVVGYERPEGGKTCQATSIENLKGMTGCPMITEAINPKLGHRRYVCNYYIPHDRKDQYTGIEIDGVKVFERDEANIRTRWQKTKEKFICEFEDGSFTFKTLHSNKGFFLNYLYQMKQEGQEIDIKIIGIAGVNKTQGEEQKWIS